MQRKNSATKRRYRRVKKEKNRVYRLKIANRSFLSFENFQSDRKRNYQLYSFENFSFFNTTPTSLKVKPHVLQCCNVAMSQCPGVRDVRVPATALAVIKDNRNPPDQTTDRVAAFSSWADFFKKSGAGGYQPPSSGLGLVLANKKTTPSPAL